MAWSCCRNYFAADDGCAFGGRHRPLLQPGGCAGAASWPTPLVHGVRQLFGARLRNLEENMLWESATLRLSTLAVLTSLISKLARGQTITILPSVRLKTVSRCDFSFCS